MANKFKNKINAEEFESQIINENLNLMNLHYWNCNFRFIDRICPICRLHKKIIMDKIYTNNINSILLNENLLLRSLLDFIILKKKNILSNIEYSNFLIYLEDEKVIHPSEIVRNFNPVDFFFLKELSTPF